MLTPFFACLLLATAPDAAPLSPVAPDDPSMDLPSGFINGHHQVIEPAPVSPSHYPARRAAGRTGSVAKYGGSIKAQNALDISMSWLAAAQNPDGSWGEGDFQAGNALVLLSFLTHGETAESKLYGKSIEKALVFLSAQKSPHHRAQQ